MQDLNHECFIISLGPSVTMKARLGEQGERIVEVEASCEQVDTEGDLILQKALLESSDEFVAHGHIDIDHYSEIGHRLGIPYPERFVIGKPLQVNDGGGKRTFVKSQISSEPSSVADTFWQSLQAVPPTTWYASVYGYNRELVDCSKGNADHPDVKRFLVKGFYWKSLAMTKTPVNQLLKGQAVVSAKSLVELVKGSLAPSLPETCGLELISRGHDCPRCTEILKAGQTVAAWTWHFRTCLGWEPKQAEAYAHAAMYKSLLDAVRI